MPGFSKRPIELRDGPLNEWSKFCLTFGLDAKSAKAASADWLGGTPFATNGQRTVQVKLGSSAHITEAAANSYRPAVWCLYRVASVPVRRRSDGEVVGTEAVPVPVSVGVAKRDALTQFPPEGIDARLVERLWVRGWDDSRPESDKWGKAVSSAAWIVQVSQQLSLPKEFWAI